MVMISLSNKLELGIRIFLFFFLNFLLNNYNWIVINSERIRAYNYEKKKTTGELLCAKFKQSLPPMLFIWSARSSIFLIEYAIVVSFP